MISPRLNLWILITVGVLLGVGALLARRGWYRAHGACQAVAYLITALMTAVWMLPVFATFFLPDLLGAKVDRTGAVAIAHGALGTAVLLLGAYVILVAGTSVIPARLRFRHYRPWMLTLLAL